MLAWVTAGSATPGVSWGSGRLAAREVAVVVEAAVTAWTAGIGTEGCRSPAVPAMAPSAARTTITDTREARALRALMAPGYGGPMTVNWAFQSRGLVATGRPEGPALELVERLEDDQGVLLS